MGVGFGGAQQNAADWQQISGGGLTPTLKRELDQLFESDSMIQVQVDTFVRLLESVQDDLTRLFAGRPSVRQIKWAIDTKVNQGSFPKDPNIKRMREKVAKFVHEMRHGETGELAALCMLTGVYIDAQARKSCPFPEEILARGPGDGTAEARRVRDAKAKLVAQHNEALDEPTTGITLPVFDAGREVGTIEVERSLRPALLGAGLAALLAALLAGAVFMALRLLPLRALRRAERKAAEQTAHVYERLVEALGGASRAGVGAPTLTETGIVLSHRLRVDARGLLARFVQTAGVEVVPFGEAHFAAAVEAWWRFGKGRHAASLNFGDCLSYAVARLAGAQFERPRADLLLDRAPAGMEPGQLPG